MIRLVVSDMDGTLVDSRKRLPPDLIPTVRALRDLGVAFAVASGRSYPALERDLAPVAQDVFFICENGTLVMERGRCVRLTPMAPVVSARAVKAALRVPGVCPVLCKSNVALTQQGCPEAFVRLINPYFPRVEVVADLAGRCADGDICKVACYDEGDAATNAWPALRRSLGEDAAVILSGENWVDVMRRDVSKGTAVRALQKALGIEPEQCMAFGDYLNDMEMLQSVGESYAMANALPQLKAVARHIAPSNDENGVIRVLRERFDLAFARRE